MTTLTQLSDRQRNKTTTINELFDAVSPAGLFGIDHANTAALSLAIFGGMFWNGSAFATLADVAITLTASQSNYVEATSAGVVSSNTSAFTAGRIKLYLITTTASGIDAITDYRTLQLQGGSIDSLSIATGSIAVSTPAISITQEWANVGSPAEQFIGVDMNITDTESAASSLLQRWRVGGVEKASIRKDGMLTLAGILTLPAGTVGAPSLILGADTTSGPYRIGANNHGWAISGAKVLDIAAAGLSVTGTLSATGATVFSAGSQFLGSTYTAAANSTVIVHSTDITQIMAMGSAAGAASRGRIRFYQGDSANDNLINSLAFDVDGNAAFTGTLSAGALTTNGGLQTFGANDSGGAGFRQVLVPNV